MGPRASNPEKPMAATKEWMSYPDAPRIVHPPPGPRSRELLAVQAELETEAVGYPHYFPIAPRSAQGSTIEDVDGNRFIDWVSGISVLNLGHRHPRLGRGPGSPGEGDLARSGAADRGPDPIPEGARARPSGESPQSLPNLFHCHRGRRGRDGGQPRRPRAGSSWNDRLLGSVPWGARRCGESNQRATLSNDQRFLGRIRHPGPLPRPLPARPRIGRGRPGNDGLSRAPRR